jgi:protein-S-isoprenylcysteine O-methyltransferase Ste14
MIDVSKLRELAQRGDTVEIHSFVLLDIAAELEALRAKAPSPPKNKPIQHTAVALFWLAGAGIYIATGLSGVSLTVPPIGVLGFGLLMAVSAVMACWLAYWSWRLFFARRSIRKSQERLEKSRAALEALAKVVGGDQK